jgi:ribosomal-protein-alanine N-acetyltransferase
MFPITLRSARLLLREFRDDDFAAVHSYGSDPEVTKYVPWGPNAPEDTRTFLSFAMDAAREEPRRDYTLAAEVEGAVVGAAHLQLVSAAHAVGEIGYVVRRDHWGKGLAQEMARILVRFGFEDLGLHRLQATCDPQNIASRRVLEGVGMRQEGHLRENFWMRGVWRDSLLYAVLDRDSAAEAGR